MTLHALRISIAAVPAPALLLQLGLRKLGRKLEHVAELGGVGGRALRLGRLASSFAAQGSEHLSQREEDGRCGGGALADLLQPLFRVNLGGSAGGCNERHLKPKREKSSKNHANMGYLAAIGRNSVKKRRNVRPNACETGFRSQNL